MRTSLVWTGVLCVCGGLWGCGEQTPEGAPNDAEVPRPGPAVIEEELGPAPEGQTEPLLPEVSPDSDGRSENEDTSDAGIPGDVSLSILGWDDAQRLVASKAGQVVVLDMWSTFCVPCRKEFPHFVQLHRDQEGAVACISYSMDYEGRASKPPETYREKVLDFLTRQEATFDNILGSDDPDILYERLSLASIPAVYVYDRQGTLRKRFDNEDPQREEFTYEADISPFVDEILSEE